MKEEVKEAKPKFEDLLSQEEKAKKDTAKKIKELEKKKKETNQNDYMAAMSMAVNLSEQQDHKKKLTKAVRAQKQGNTQVYEAPVMNSKKKTQP